MSICGQVIAEMKRVPLYESQCIRNFIMLCNVQCARPSANVVHRLRTASVNASRDTLDQHAQVSIIMVLLVCNHTGKTIRPIRLFKYLITSRELFIACFPSRVMTHFDVALLFVYLPIFDVHLNIIQCFLPIFTFCQLLRMP